MNQEARRILERVRSGEITPVEGERLLGRMRTSAAAGSADRAAVRSEVMNVGESLADPDAVVAWVLDEISSVFGLDRQRLSARESFGRLGIDSRGLVELMTRLEGLVGPLPRTLLFEYPTPERLGRHIAARYGDAVSRPGDANPTRQATTAPTVESRAFGSASRNEPIAIIGISGRYPMADDLDELWQRLVEAQNCVIEVPKERWDWREVHDPTPGTLGKSCNRWGGFISGVDQFDPDFFGISPREAEMLDPEERLFLETVWQALDDAGYSRQALAAVQAHSGRGIGVFAGCMYRYYGRLAEEAGFPNMHPTASYWSLANRLSYVLGLNGPSMAVDTACSSSMTAIHVACESIRSGESVMAIAGGVNISIHPAKYIGLNQTGLLGSTAESRPLGVSDGFVPSEGVGAVVLKPLAAALRDNDVIHAVIIGSSANHGGMGSGYAAPNPAAQALLMRGALERFGIEPASIGYIEVAALGSPLGDAVEIAALREVFPAGTWGKDRCPIGSVKSNIGHSEAASGISQLSKVVLQLEHEQLVPTINCDPLNPELQIEQSAFRVQREHADWRRGTSPRRAAINSFGAGGAYAHLVVEEAPERPRSTAAARSQLIVLSATGTASLQKSAARLLAFLSDEKNAAIPFADIAFSLHCRESFSERMAFVAADAAEACRKLATYMAGNRSDFFRGGVTPQFGVPASLGAALDLQDDRVRRTALEQAAKEWLEGRDFDRTTPSSGPLPRRVSLPAYPFTRRRCWIPNVKPSGKSVEARPSPIADDDRATRRGADAHEDARTPNVAETVEGLVCELLGVEHTDSEMEKPFLRLGLSSIAAVRLVRGVNQTFGLALKTTAVFDHASPAAFADFVAERVAALPRSVAQTPVSLAPPPDHGRTGVSVPHPAGELRAVVLTGPSETSDLSIAPLRPRDPAAGEVRIAVCAFALNFGDLLCMKGLYPTMPEYPFTPGFEVAGEVIGVGPGVRRWRVGQQVFALTGPAFGGHAAEVCVPESLVAAKPAKISFEEAAAFPVAYITMRHVFETAGLSKGETILIQSAAGGLGLVGVQMALRAGAEIFATAGSEEKLEYLRKLGAAHTINYRVEDFASRIRELTGGRGVDVVVNTLSGDAIQKGVDLLAPEGRYIEVAVAGLQASGRIDFSRLVDNQSFHSVDLRRLGGRRPELLATYFAAMERDLASGAIKPTIARVFDMDEVGAAYAFLEQRRNIGKVVVRVPQQHRPSAQASAPPVAMTVEPPAEQAIAIVGMSGRMPGAADLEAFWENLAAGRTSIADVPAERWDWHPYYDPKPEQPGRIYCKSGGFVGEIDRFDARFFKMSASEAEVTDPQQRLFLEECWKALEDAGQPPSALRGSSCGVFVGCAAGDYAEHLKHTTPVAHAFWGNSPSLIASRISYFLDLHGPSVAIDTACSSSLVAVHMAVQSIRSGECEMALAGGVFLSTTPNLFLSASLAGMLAPDGRCKAFDDGADGFVSGEAVGAVVLKPLERALRDGDTIHAVIRGSGVNQDGHTYGITAPSVQSQAELERSVYRQAGIDPGTIQYIETHGTGTKLGDPIEVDALTQAFEGSTAERNFCALGSVKTNIGHAAAAAGIAGLLKVVVSMDHGAIPPSLNYEKANSHIRFEDSPFFVNTTRREWLRPPGGVRRAAISSFGFSGTNAHLLLEEFPAEARPVEQEETRIVPLSAKDEERLTESIRRLRSFVGRSADLRMDDLAHTLQSGREAMESRAAFIVASRQQLIEALDRYLAGDRKGIAKGRVTRASAKAASVGDAVSALLDAAAGSRRTGRLAGGAPFAQLAELWCQGAAIDWSRMPGQSNARRIPLPTYPFARDRFWIDAGPMAQPVRSSAPAVQASLVTSPAIDVPSSEFVAAPAVAFEDALRLVVDAVAEEMGIASGSIDPVTPFAELGADSILVRSLLARIEQHFGPIPTSVLMDAGSPEKLARYLAASHSLIAPRAEPAAEERSKPVLTAAVTPLARSRPVADSAIAVVGIAGRYPDAATLDELWQNLREGRSSVRQVPADRWDAASLYDGDPSASESGRVYCRWGSFLSGVDQFDPYFFGITPSEAKWMAPEERMLLEVVWRLLEDANIPRSALAGRRVGVFIGITSMTYPLVVAEAQRPASADTSFFSVANRISHWFDFKGPSLAIDTGCSSSLVAVHQACEGLRRGECDYAIAGGANLYLHPDRFLRLCRARLLASEPQALFSSRAIGFMPGEGIGAVMLEPLASAREAGHSVRGAIRGSRVGHSGKTSAYFLPSAAVQAELIAGAVADSGVDLSSVSYCEAQAIGSPAADAAEWSGLTRAFRDSAAACAVGSLKGSLGHMEAASGVAQLTKVLLQMEHGELLPAPFATDLNPEIRTEGTPLRLQREIAPWVTSGDSPRRAMISSTGAGGVSASLLVEEVPRQREGGAGESSTGPQLVILSARSEGALRQMAAELAEAVGTGDSAALLADVAWTLQTGREEFSERAAFVVASVAELTVALEAFAAGRSCAIPNVSGKVDPAVRRQHARSGETASMLDDGPLDENALARLAKLWCEGAGVDWQRLAGGSPRTRVALPGHPFERIRCWIDGPVAESAVETYYNRVASVFESSNTEVAGTHLVFAPLPERIPGFSWMSVWLEPEKNARYLELITRSQQEMKERLFSRADFGRAAAVLDIGCGYGTDLIALATRYPHLRCDGYTLSENQMRLAGRAAANAGVSDRVRFFCRNSARDEFPQMYDVAIGFEVTFHVEDKTALFSNIARHLKPGGTLLLADTVTLTKVAVSSGSLGQFTPTQVEFARVLAEQGLEINQSVDVSREIANFLHDPEFETNLRRVTEKVGGMAGVEQEHRGYDYFGRGLDEGLFRYLLLSIDLVNGVQQRPLLEVNLERLETSVSYSDGRPVTVAYRAPMPAPQLSEQEIHAAVVRIASELFEIPEERLDIDMAFADLGIGSLHALRLVDRINRVLDLELRVEAVFENPSVRLLAEHVESAASRRKVQPRAEAAAIAATANAAAATDVAIIGFSCRFADAADAAEYWRNLATGRNCVHEVPAERWDWTRYFDATKGKAGRTYSKWGGFISDVDRFDPLFFRMSRREADLADPQQRLFLEECWKALEVAGYATSGLAGSRCGVFAGFVGSDYSALIGGEVEAQAFWGNAGAVVPARISYFLDLRGPAVSVDTACSSSLMAVHLACKSIQSGESEMALAGGVYVGTTPNLFLSSSLAGMLAQDDRCKAFDDAGDGFVIGEGVGVVVLKRLDHALRDGDSIHAVIRGSGANQDGRTNGITAPSLQAQAELERLVYREAGISPRSIQYVEAHGTGTKLGDPIEVAGLTEAFRSFTDERQFCALGSVKANIGHSSAAAGIASLIKAVLALKSGKIPPQINVTRLNGAVDMANSPFYVNTDLRQWPRPVSSPRRAAVSSFGFSGTNVHVVLDEFIETARGEAGSGPWLIPISARDEQRLAELVRRLRDFIMQEPAIRLDDLAFTMQNGREAMAARLAVVAASRHELIDRLDRFLGEKREGLSFGIVRPSILAKADRTAVDIFTLDGRRAHTTAAVLERVARLWCDGSVVDWSTLPEQRGCRRIPLPTYPFARERHWIGPATTQVRPQVAAPEPRSELRFFESQWAAAPAAASVSTDGTGLLVFADEARAWAHLRPWLVLPGERFELIADSRMVVVPPGDESAYCQLLTALEAHGHTITTAVHTWSWGQGRSGLESQLDRGIRSLTCWAKALDQRRSAATTLIVHDGESASAACAAIALTLNRERSAGRWKAVRVDGPLRPDSLVAELSAKDAVEAALTPQGRFVGRIQAIDASTPEPFRLPLEKGIIITGGAGALGGVMARHLIGRGCRRLMLVGRSAPSAKIEAALADLRRSGADVVYRSADVASAPDVNAFTREARSRFGSIGALVHLAGVIRDSLIRNKKREDLEAVLAPKIRGTLNLDAATAADSLDCFVLFSSLASHLGNAGQSDYAFANRFLDEFALRREAMVAAGTRSGRTRSIGWPLWRDGGMHFADHDAEVAFLAGLGLAHLETADALVAFERALAFDAVHLAILVGDPVKLDQICGPVEGRRAGKPIAPLRENRDERRAAPLPNQRQQPAAGAASIVDQLRQILAGQVGLSIDEIDADVPMFDYGLDSMIATGFLQLVQMQYGPVVSLNAVAEHVTIAGLADFISGTLPQAAPAPDPPARPASTDVDGGLRVAANAATRTSIVDHLRELLAEQLHLSAEDVDADTPMLDYGLDSILATGFLQLVQMHYGPVVSLNAVAEQETIARLAEYISARVTVSAPAPAPAPAPVLRRPKENVDPGELLRINAMGSQHPSFWMHGAPGLAQMYTKLSAALGPDYPLYAFQARGVDGTRQPFVDIAEMTSFYADVILDVQHEGPYFIGGYSYGGLVAFDLAQRLASRGKEIGHLYIIDSYPPQMLNEFPTEKRPFIRKLQRIMNAVMFFSTDKGIRLWDYISVADLKDIPDEAEAAHIARLIKERVPTPLPLDHIYRFLHGVDVICSLSERMARSYELKVYDASPVTFFKTEGLIAIDSPLAVPGLTIEEVGLTPAGFERVEGYDYIDIWRSMVRTEIKVSRFECDHMSLLEKPHVTALAEQISRTLTRCDDAGRHSADVVPLIRRR